MIKVKVCHFDEGEIFTSNSAIKIANLCRASRGDFSFVEMTKNERNLCVLVPSWQKLTFHKTQSAINQDQ